MSFTSLFIVVCTLGAFLGVLALVLQGVRKNVLENMLCDVRGFDTTRHVIGNDDFSALAIDEAQNAVCMISLSEPGCRRISYKDLLSVELLEDGCCITQTVRENRVRTVLDQPTQPKHGVARRLELRVRFNDGPSPLHEIVFLNSPVPKDSDLYRQALEQALRWTRVLEGLMRRAEAQEQPLEQSTTRLPLRMAPAAYA